MPALPRRPGDGACTRSEPCPHTSQYVVPLRDEERGRALRPRTPDDRDASPAGADGNHIAVKIRIAQPQVAIARRYRGRDGSVPEVQKRQRSALRSGPALDAKCEHLRQHVPLRPPEGHDAVVRQRRERSHDLAARRRGIPRGRTEVRETLPGRSIVEVNAAPRIRDPASRDATARATRPDLRHPDRFAAARPRPGRTPTRPLSGHRA